MEISQQTIKACQAGDSEALALVYDSLVKQIFDYHYYRTLHKETAEDLTSQTFMKVIENIRKYDIKKASLTTWVYTIARNTLYDNFRTKKIDINIDDVWHLSIENNMEKNLDIRENLKLVEEYLEKLEPLQREIILLRVWDGLSHREIADIMGKSEAACKMSFSRAINKLRLENPEFLAVLFLFKYLI